jgi:hypothetical protein
MKFISKLKDQAGAPFTELALANATWFSVDRSTAQSYIGAIVGTNLYVWTKDGTWCTVTAPGGGAVDTSYLTVAPATEPSFHFRSIQDTTIITNRGTTTAMQEAPVDGVDYVSNSVATLKLLTLTSGDEYTVTLQNEADTVTAQSSTTFDDMLLYTAGAQEDVPDHHLIDGIKDLIETQQS